MKYSKNELNILKQAKINCKNKNIDEMRELYKINEITTQEDCLYNSIIAQMIYNKYKELAKLRLN